VEYNPSRALGQNRLPRRRQHAGPHRSLARRQRLVCSRVSGCGGFLVELLLNPIVNAAAGLPAAAGKNTAILNNTVNIAASFAVLENDELNPSCSSQPRCSSGPP
jgi:hypothetical protein